MIAERDFEDILCKYPELIEEGLILRGRQVCVYGRRMDILFEDKFGRKLITELKIGPIKDAHMGQVLSYEGMLLSAEDPTIRVMLIGNRVPPNVQRSLDHHGIAWREITLSTLKDFLREKNDHALLHLFEEYGAAEKESHATLPDKPGAEPSLPALSPPLPAQAAAPSQFSRAPAPGTQLEIIDAILGAYPCNREGKWLSAKRQVELLQRAYDAKLPDGRNAFPAMHGGAERGDGRTKWDGENRTNRVKHHVKQGRALKADGRNLYMLANGVTPAAMGVSQRVVDALATHNVIPRYDVNATNHVAPERS